MAVDMEAPPGVWPWWWTLDPALDNQEGIDDAPRFGDALGTCVGRRFPWWLLNMTTGLLVCPRCKSPNKCSHCRRLAARETVEMLSLAAEEAPPSLYLVLTTSEFVTRAQLRRDLCQIRRSIRLIWPRFEYFCALEWQKRGAIHVNLLVRGVAASLRDALLSRVLRVWKRRHRAVAAAQSVQEVRGAGRVAAYVHKLGEYLAKDDQAAPPGWRGHRSSQTRGFLPRPAAEMRPEAIRSLQWKALRAPLLARGVDPCSAGWMAWDELEVRLSDVWGRYAAGCSTYRESAAAAESVRKLLAAASVSLVSEEVPADEHVDVGAVVGRERLSGGEHEPALEVVVAAVRRASAEQVGRLVDRGATWVMNQRGRFWKHSVWVERCDVPNDGGSACGGSDRPRLPGMDRQELNAIDLAQRWPRFSRRRE